MQLAFERYIHVFRVRGPPTPPKSATFAGKHRYTMLHGSDTEGFHFHPEVNRTKSIRQGRVGGHSAGWNVGGTKDLTEFSCCH